MWTLTLALLTCLGIDFSHPLLPGVVRFDEAETVHALRAERSRSDERPTRPPEPARAIDVAMTPPRPTTASVDRPDLQSAAGLPRGSIDSVRGATTAAGDH